MTTPPVDALGRPDIAQPIRDEITRAFQHVKGRGALLIIADETGTRAHLAAKFGDHWKVAAGGGFAWDTKQPVGFIAVEAVW
jgi:hypothetical protein